MNGKIAIVLLAGLLAACVPAQPPAASAPPAPPPAPAPAAAAVPGDHIVNIRGASCADLLRLSPEDRADAAMFYIGYQASRSRSRTINVSLIPGMESLAVSYCTAYPGRSAAQAFAQAYSDSRAR